MSHPSKTFIVFYFLISKYYENAPSGPSGNSLWISKYFTLFVSFLVFLDNTCPYDHVSANKT